MSPVTTEAVPTGHYAKPPRPGTEAAAGAITTWNPPHRHPSRPLPPAATQTLMPPATAQPAPREPPANNQEPHNTGGTT
jgi:hypothetical protein